VLFPLLAAEIVIARAFCWLFAPLPGQFITRLLHGQGGQGEQALAAAEMITVRLIRRHLTG
jgi:hypothetical protein